MSDETHNTGNGGISDVTKVALLEQQIRHLEKRVCKSEEAAQKMSAKLDEKVAADTWRQLESERTIARILATMESIANDLKEASEAASKAQKLATKHETVASTIMKVGSVLTVVGGAVWTIVTFVISHLD